MLTVNGRTYRPPAVPTVVVCVDGCEPDYLAQAVAGGHMPWLKRTLATWPDPQQTRPTLSYEALDVMRMELPPGWRGYGAKDYVDHPATAARAEQVAATRERLAGGSRHELQHALMPYDELLPASLRGRNERIDEPL